MKPISRRQFIAALTAGGIAGAGETAMPLDRYVVSAVPGHVDAGKWAMISTTCRECPAGCGMSVFHRDGRATKAEGHPGHPVNFGALCPRGQSSVQGLYDPDRIRTPLHRTNDGTLEPTTWTDAFMAVGGHMKTGVRTPVFSRLETGSLRALMERFTETAGGELLLYEPFGYHVLRNANRRVYGMPLIPDYRLDECDLIVSFGADFLENWVSPVGYARLFSRMHAPGATRDGIFLYAGPRLSMTAANADEFLSVPHGREDRFAAALFKALTEVTNSRFRIPEGIGTIRDGLTDTISGEERETAERWARRITRAQRPLILAGPAGIDTRPAERAAVFAALINEMTGAVAAGTVDFSRPHAIGDTADSEKIASFFDAITGGDIVIIHDVNPVYHIPGAAGALKRASLTVYLGSMMDETAELADWVLPVDSPLEAWGDYEPIRGLVSLQQPVTGRLYDSRAAGDVFTGIAAAAGTPVTLNGRQIRNAAAWRDRAWRRMLEGDENNNFETARDRVLASGIVARDIPDVTPRMRFPEDEDDIISTDDREGTPSGAVRLFAWPPVMWFDGRVSNRGWLQELPDPVNAITWGSWAELNPSTATEHGIAADDLIRIKTAAGETELPAVIRAGVAPGTLAIPFGQGHTALGRNARGRGANAFALLGSPVAGAAVTTASIEPAGESRTPAYIIATTNQHHREILRWTSPGSDGEFHGPPPGEPFDLPNPEGYTREDDLYPPHEHAGHRWVMVVDLARCIGCGACTVACFAENNIPVTGEGRVRDGLEQHWLKVIPYRSGDDESRIGFLPMLCQHCDAAPCEPVCPVFASVHNEEGLNAQIYNRCIGTRYCSNNCPYKVRRFNWFNHVFDPPLDLQLNPDVTVRSRGVMEKCTFCIQRIRRGEHHAAKEGRPVRDGEIVPACAQTCPTGAIVFGDLMDPSSRAARLTRNDPRRYHVLEELNTKPGVTYLKRVRRQTREGTG